MLRIQATLVTAAVVAGIALFPGAAAGQYRLGEAPDLHRPGEQGSTNVQVLSHIPTWADFHRRGYRARAGGRSAVCVRTPAPRHHLQFRAQHHQSDGAPPARVSAEDWNNAPFVRGANGMLVLGDAVHGRIAMRMNGGIVDHDHHHDADH